MPTTATGRGGGPAAAAVRMENPGGSALIGGVMMACQDRMAAAVRAPDGTIRVEVLPELAPRPWARMARQVPFARGLAALATSISASVAALLWSARVSSPNGGHVGGLRSARPARYTALAFAAVLSVAPFWAIHAALASIGGGRLAGATAEAGLRLSLLAGYIWAVGRWHRIADVFGYHGAEHKTITCYEAGDPLVPSVVAGHSRFHPRCGTAFAFWAVMVVSAVGAAAGDLGPLAGAAVRLAGLLLAVSVGYEIVRTGARSGATRWGRLLRAPGVALQHLSTREPRLDQIETAIAALRACATDAQRADIDRGIEDWMGVRAA